MEWNASRHKAGPEVLDVDSLRLTIHGEAFYGTNREHIETIRVTETTGGDAEEGWGQDQYVGWASAHRALARLSALGGLKPTLRCCVRGIPRWLMTPVLGRCLSVY